MNQSPPIPSNYSVSTNLEDVPTCDLLAELKRRHVNMNYGGKRVIFLGAPGCGKGTQSAVLKEKYKLGHLSTGDMLREEVALGTELGKMAKKIMDNGELVNDEVVLQLVENRISSKECTNGFILDGFPRNLTQAISLDAVCNRINLPIHAVIYFDIPSELLMRRVCGRRVHLPSGRIYHTEFNPPKVEGLDDVTGEPLTHRRDDNEETMRKRFTVFNNETKPVMSHYQQQHTLHIVDATLTPEQTTKTLIEIFDNISTSTI